jgi:uncharacterized membrane protein YqjE
MNIRRSLSLKDKAGMHALGSVVFLFLIPITLLIGIFIFDWVFFDHAALTLLIAAVISILSAAIGTWYTATAVQYLLRYSRDQVEKDRSSR